jgi:hypothetical protein
LTAKPKEARALYFDIKTNPGSIYMPMDVEIVMPETKAGSGVLAASICRVELDYVGINSLCVQKELVNDPQSGRVSYFQR